MPANNKHLNSALRHDFLLIFDVTNGNPNGDPDAGDLPRMDGETQRGIVSDVAIKRKLRNWVDQYHGGEERNKIYMQHGDILNENHQRAYTALNIKSVSRNQPREEVEAARQWMCANYYDVRTFGAVMGTSVNAGQVRGPVQLTFGTSIDPISPQEMTVTRVAITNAKDAKTGEDITATGTMGRKTFIPYGLFRSEGFIVPAFAEDTGFNDEDLGIFWQGLLRMWDLDRSASRGRTNCIDVIVFTHDSPLGNAPAHRLFDRISIKRNNPDEPARHHSDYTISVDDAKLPAGITVTRLADHY